MNIYNKYISNIKNGEIIVIPTDTIYGIVCDALNKKSVEILYKVRKRSPNKPFIILIDSIEKLKMFGIKKISNELLNKLWPNKLTIIFSCKLNKYKYLHRGLNSLAFRIPKNKELRDFLKLTGPIVAPSANHEGEKPAKSITQAKKYFNNDISIYIDKGYLNGKASTIIEIKEDGGIALVREGAFKVGKFL